MNRFFFIDYDNTIFSHRTGSTPESALNALVRLKQSGHKVFISSGRSFRGDLSDIFVHRFTPDGLVSANGAIVEAEGKVLRDACFPPEIQRRLFDFVLEKDYCLMANYQNTWCTSSLHRFLSRPDAPEAPGLPLGREVFLQLYDKPLTSLFLEEDREAMMDIEQHFLELKLLRMSDEAGGADIVLRENSKANGIRRVLDYYHAVPSDAVAIGDSMNDLEMIRFAGLGIAMGNAMQAVCEAADYVAKDIDEGGLWDAVDYALRQDKP